MGYDGPRFSGTEGMSAAFAAALQRLMAATGGAFSIYSGARTYEHQKYLWEQELAKQGGNVAAARHNVAPPGLSNHNKGVAADISFRDARAQALVHQLAPQFGLIFPMGHEDWHIEPVNARDAAAAEAYTFSTDGSLHPKDPMYQQTRPDVTAAQLANALGAFDPSMLELLEGGYPEGAAPPEEAQPAAGAGPAGGAGGGGGESGMGGNAESWIRQAMKITGVGEDWYPGLMRRMMQESGGRNIPQNAAVNDINMRTGNPAFGPMQVIRTTFEANKLPGYENWKDPLHNTIAAIRYIQQHPKYGHPDKLNPNTGY